MTTLIKAAKETIGRAVVYHQEGGGVSRVNIGRLITTSVTSRHTFMIFEMEGNVFVRYFCKR